uniref:Uncharacterized protein n=1 Tax=Rhizophora mucronata TaxID=61149 RepID=A0A2P2PQ32_RHIMU
MVVLTCTRNTAFRQAKQPINVETYPWLYA